MQEKQQQSNASSVAKKTHTSAEWTRNECLQGSFVLFIISAPWAYWVYEKWSELPYHTKWGSLWMDGPILFVSFLLAVSAIMSDGFRKKFWGIAGPLLVVAGFVVFFNMAKHAYYQLLTYF